MDCSLPGSSIHGIFQARILEWVTTSFSRRSSWPRVWTWVSHIVGRCFTIWATREVKDCLLRTSVRDFVIRGCCTKVSHLLPIQTCCLFAKTNLGMCEQYRPARYCSGFEFGEWEESPCIFGASSIPVQGIQAVDTKRGTSFLVLLRAVTIFTQGESVEGDLGESSW